MSNRKAVVVGALGVIGRALVNKLVTSGDWDVIGLSRRAPDAQTGARYISVDLLDREDTRSKLSELTSVSHVFYAAYQARPTLSEEVAPNLTMLENAVEAIDAASPDLAHVNLMEGGKAYGCHLGPFKTPARESDPRHMPPNFYYNQEDWLRQFSESRDWTWSALRPEAVCGFSVGTPMNLTMVIAVYAAICRELEVPFHFPGKPGAYTAMYEVTDASLLASAALWASTTPSCGGEVFNITNGDTFRWQNVWPVFADSFGLAMAEPRPMPLVDFMADKGPVWDRIVERHGLRPVPYEQVVSWGFGDAIFGSDWDIVRSTNKARSFGFAECIDTEDMFTGLFDALQADKVIPSPGRG